MADGGRGGVPSGFEVGAFLLQMAEEGSATEGLSKRSRSST